MSDLEKMPELPDEIYATIDFPLIGSGRAWWNFNAQGIRYIRADAIKPEHIEPKTKLQFSFTSPFNVKLKDLMGWLELVCSEEWTWCRNTMCKYVNIRIDTRHGGSCILAAGDNGTIPARLENLLRQGDEIAMPRQAEELIDTIIKAAKFTDEEILAMSEKEIDLLYRCSGLDPHATVKRMQDTLSAAIASQNKEKK